MPEKNAKRAINDEMVAAIFRLTENMVRILGYVPIEEGQMGNRFVVRPAVVLSRDDHSEELKIRREAPTAEDEARYFLLKEHIENLRKFANPEIHSPPRSKSDIHDMPSGFHDDKTQAGYNLYRKWQQPK
jgi:hypothetical protein